MQHIITRPRVLCVDDDEDSREMLTQILKLALIEAKTVGTAVQALSSMQTERFDLYVIDAWLPKIDGFELCRRMRAIDRHTPILFFSGAAHTADRQKGLEAGANAYLVKPEINNLVQTITQFVGQAETATAQVIPFRPKTSLYPNFPCGPLAA
jgi:two-component system, OmpR family, response regulator